MPPARRKKTAEARLLGLASFILSQPEPVTRARIFEAFPDDYGGRPDAAERRFSRDKDALRRLGFHLETEELGSREDQIGYHIDARSSALPAVELSPDEAAAVWTAGIGALRLSRHPLRDELESALRKLVVGGKGLPPRAAAAEDLLPAGGVESGKLLERLADAWERRRRLRIAYWRSSSGEVIERDVDVYGWARRRGEWIFVGWCHLRKGVRIFYLSRVRGMKLVPGEYDIPEGFDVRRWSRQQIWEYEVHPPQQAVIRFTGSLARIAPQLLPGARFSRDEAGARVARLPVRNLRGLVRQALAWGPEAEVVEPAEARAVAREVLSSLAPSPRWGTP